MKIWEGWAMVGIALLIGFLFGAVYGMPTPHSPTKDIPYDHQKEGHS